MPEVGFGKKHSLLSMPQENDAGEAGAKDRALEAMGERRGEGKGGA